MSLESVILAGRTRETTEGNSAPLTMDDVDSHIEKQERITARSKYPKSAKPETLELISMLVAPVMSAKRWNPEFSEDEIIRICNAWGCVADYYIDDVSVHPVIVAAGCTAFTFMPRMKKSNATSDAKPDAIPSATDDATGEGLSDNEVEETEIDVND